MHVGALQGPLSSNYSQMESLRLRLGELHCTDVNALRRAYKTLCQHVEALDQEARGMLEELQSMETEVLTPEVVASEVRGAAGVAAGASWPSPGGGPTLPAHCTTGVARRHGAFQTAYAAEGGWLPSPRAKRLSSCSAFDAKMCVRCSWGLPLHWLWVSLWHTRP